jgi:hypothetical protein
LGFNATFILPANDIWVFVVCPCSLVNFRISSGSPSHLKLFDGWPIPRRKNSGELSPEITFECLSKSGPGGPEKARCPESPFRKNIAMLRE